MSERRIVAYLVLHDGYHVPLTEKEYDGWMVTPLPMSSYLARITPKQEATDEQR